MRTFNVLLACAALAMSAFIGGCGDSSDEDAIEVKPMETYREEAAKEINKDNVKAELDKVEKEIEADTD
jgi:hypothetical protein